MIDIELMDDTIVVRGSHFSSILLEVNNAQQQQDREANTPLDHDNNDTMQQQLVVHPQTDDQGPHPPAIPHESSATNPAGLGQLNTMLVNMLQQSAAQTQPGQQNPMQNTVLAQIIAAANGANFHNSSQHAPGAGGTNLPSGSQGQQHQAGAFMEQPAASQIPVIAGVQSLQQQLMMIQQQLGGGFAPPQQNIPQYQPTPPPQQHQQGQFGSQQIQQFAPAPYPQQFPFMSHMGQGFNPALFHNYGAFGPFGQFGGGNNVEPAVFMNQVQMPNNGMQGFDGVGTAYQQGAFPMQQQPVIQSENPSNNKKMEKPKGATPLKSKPGEEGPDRGRKPDPTKRSAKTFPEKLMQAMMMVVDDDIVAWLPDGKSFVVVDPERICAEVLAKVFKESKYPSFVRKLHRCVVAAMNGMRALKGM